jgi:Uma2 family endonuclease
MGDGMNVMARSDAAPSADPQPFMLRIEDYQLLERSGAFHGQRVELIEGRIIRLNAQFAAHAIVKNRLGRRLQQVLEAIGSSHEAIIEGSLALSPHDLPDPDILVGAMSATRDYFHVEQIALVVEVADTSIRYDLGQKRDLYAAHGVAEYWVVDLAARDVHQFSAVSGGIYAQTRAVPLGGEVRSATMADLAIDGRGIL